MNNLEKGPSSENNTPIKVISEPRNLVDTQENNFGIPAINMFKGLKEDTNKHLKEDYEITVKWGN